MMTPFPRYAVRLLAGVVRDRQTRNGEYLLSLTPDRLLHNFRVNAGLPSSAKPLGGWESPRCGLRGHFTGHALTALSQQFAATGDGRFRGQLDALVDGLADCQYALGDGYLAAFPSGEFDTFERTFGGVWAPYYTLHKILAGLLAAADEGQNRRALEVARRLGDWVVARIARLPPETLEAMLRTDQLNPSNEYGGIGEALYDLFAATGDGRYQVTAEAFDRAWFIDPLAAGDDRLAGLHANTHIPQALAAARRYGLTGDDRFRRAAEFFWDRTALARSYVNGGSSGPRPDRRERSEGGEHWPDARAMRHTLTPKINESCVTHNMLRLTDAVARWCDDPRLAEFRERAFLNGVLGMQHPRTPGAYLYSHPLAGGSRKVYGDFDQTFWCCYGTSVETFARLADGIYTHDGDVLAVTYFVASRLDWSDRGIRVTQQTAFPREPSTRLIIEADAPVTFTLSVRIPCWAQRPAATLNGEPLPDVVAGRALPISRAWRNGDVVEVSMPMAMRVETLPGDPSHAAFVYGPVVLAARTPHAPEFGVPGTRAMEAIVASDPKSLTFVGRLVSGHDVPLVPLNEIVDETYGVYFKVVEPAAS